MSSEPLATGAAQATATGVQCVQDFASAVRLLPVQDVEAVCSVIKSRHERQRTISRLGVIWRLDYPDLARTTAAKAIEDDLAQLPRRRARMNRFSASLTDAEKRLLALPESMPKGWRAIADYLEESTAE
ncbi:MAG: hypothetical protein KDJ28_00575 [Candidatus Competibacteraceae bacterium]|nr:hypothetical protein [Candidatus Competibacteraceae bacterium]